MKWLQKTTLIFFFIGWISIEALAIRCAHAFQSFNQPNHVLMKLYLVHLQWFGNLFNWHICATYFKMEIELKIYLYRGSRSRQIMSYKFLLIIFLIGWISSEFGAIGLHTSQVTLSHSSLLYGFELMSTRQWFVNFEAEL